MADCNCPSLPQILKYVEANGVFKRHNMHEEIDSKLRLPNHTTSFMFYIVSLDDNFNDCSIQCSEKDANGNYTLFKLIRFCGSLYKTYKFSKPDSKNNYTILTHDLYNDFGNNVLKQLVWNISYDTNGYFKGMTKHIPEEVI